MLKNKIDGALLKEGMSINALSGEMEMDYKTVHTLVNREFLDDTKLGTVEKVAGILEVDITDLYDSVYDPSEFEEVRILNKALGLIAKNSHVGQVGDRAYECLERLTDDIEEFGIVDRELLSNAKKAAIDSARYAGYTNVQYSLQDDVREMLDEI